MRNLAMLSLLFAAACNGDSPVSSLPESPVPFPSAQLLQVPAGAQVVPGQYIVALRAGVPIRETVQALAAQLGFSPQHVFDRALPGFAARLGPAILERLRADARVDFIEPDVLVTFDGSQSPTPSWGLDRIDQRNLPSNNTYNYNTTGAGVHAYIIDTGINFSHVDFASRIGLSYDAYTSGGTAADCNGHGSHVSGTVGGTTYGVAKAVTLHAVRVFPCSGSTPTSIIIAGINWIITNVQLPAVANMSLGGGASASMDAAVVNMINAGVFTSVSAGNDYGLTSSCNKSPARVAQAMTVGSTDSNDARSVFSNFGACVDIFAPGGSITSAWWTSPTASAILSGTSMSSPHVAGAGALYLESNPGATPAQVMSTLLAQSTSGIPTAAPSKMLYTGFISGNIPPTADFTYECSSVTLKCTFDASSSFDLDGGLQTITLYEWIAGGTVRGTGQVVDYTFPSPASFPLTLRVTDDGGATDQVTKPVTTANQAPSADFTYSCAGLFCTFDASSSTDPNGDGTITTYEWLVGGVVRGTGKIVTYTFPGPTSITLTVRVTDEGGLTDSVAKPVNVTVF